MYIFAENPSSAPTTLNIIICCLLLGPAKPDQNSADDVLHKCQLLLFCSRCHLMSLSFCSLNGTALYKTTAVCHFKSNQVCLLLSNFNMID